MQSWGLSQLPSDADPQLPCHRGHGVGNKRTQRCVCVDVAPREHERAAGDAGHHSDAVRDSERDVDVGLDEEPTALRVTLKEEKYYCPGKGLVLTVDTATGDREELISVTMP